MMSLGPGNSGFDLAFFVLEFVALLASLVLAASAKARARRGTLLPVQIAIGLVAVVGLPMVWNIGWPPSGAFEVPGRVLFGGAACGLNAIVCVLACAFSPRLSRDRRSSDRRRWSERDEL
jgi:hypothetical protein